MNTTSIAGKEPSTRVRIVVATSVMLTFISWYRAAAIILNDLGSSAFYAGSIAEQAFGKSAPWFIIGVMLFSFAVRAVYVESCSMFVRGGVYRIVKEALGGTLAKMAVSALMFDYILTGPISGVSAGQYIAGLHQRDPFRRLLLWLVAASGGERISRKAAHQRKRYRGGSGVGSYALLLVAERQGNRGIQRESPVGHADHDCYGDHAAGLVRHHFAEARL